MQKSKAYNVFISHAWEYINDYYILEDKLLDARSIKCKIFSIPENDPLLNPRDPHDKRFLFNDLEEQIRPVHCVLIISGMYDKGKVWIQKEIDIAKSLGKPIIGIKSRGLDIIPKAIKDAAVAIVEIGEIGSIIASIKNSLIKKNKCA